MTKRSSNLTIKQVKQQQNYQKNNEQQNQREFRCKCLKIYKSYPALYTHIKNKHPNQIQQFKLQSKKPKQGDIQKGRPKKHRNRPQSAQDQGELLNIIDLGVLQIDQILKNTKNNQINNNNNNNNSSQINTQNNQINVQKNQLINSNTTSDLNNQIKIDYQILQGNNQLKQQDLSHQYTKTKDDIISYLQDNINSDKSLEIFIQKLKSHKFEHLQEQQSIKIYTEQIKFKNQLIQHFNSIIASKILLQLQIIQVQMQLQVYSIVNTQNSNTITLNYTKNQNSYINSEDYQDKKNYQQNYQINSYQFLNIINLAEQVLWGQNKLSIVTQIRNIYKKWNQKVILFTKKQLN